MRTHEGVCPGFTFNRYHISATCSVSPSVCRPWMYTQKTPCFSTLKHFITTRLLYLQKKQKQKKTMFKVSFLQARIRVTVQETVWIRSSSYISVKYRLGSELTVHLSSGCCVLNWQNCQASSLVLNSEKLVSLMFTSSSRKHWLSFIGL